MATHFRCDPFDRVGASEMASGYRPCRLREQSGRLPAYVAYQETEAGRRQSGLRFHLLSGQAALVCSVLPSHPEFHALNTLYKVTDTLCTHFRARCR